MAAYFYVSNYSEINAQERPSPKYIQRYVIVDHAVRWKQIGRILGVKGIENIEMSHSQAPQECLEEILDKWLKVDVGATWNKLENALNQAIQDKLGIGNQNVTENEGLTLSKQPTDGQETLASDGLATNSAVKPKESAATSQLSPNLPVDEADRRDGRDEIDNDGTKCKTAEKKIEYLQKKTKYTVVHKKKPLLSLIIGNENFDHPEKFCKLDGTPTDMENMKTFLNIYGIQGNEEVDVGADVMRDAVKRLSKRNFSKYSGLIVTIITHGGEGDVLYGTDGQSVQLKELAKLFNSSECRDLRNKPKIFIINACRGIKQNRAVPLGPQDSKLSSLSDYTPLGADFLFVHSCTDDYKAYMSPETGSPFINQLVTVLEEKLEAQHFEHALLKVKEKVAGELLRCDDDYYKQMPSVVSQMRFELWWVK